MELKPHGAAWIIATGMVLSSLIILAAADRASERLSRALEKAGANTRPDIHVPQAPTSLKLELDELTVALKQLQGAAPARTLEPADRARLMQAFAAAVQGKQDREGRLIRDVSVEALHVASNGKLLTAKGTLGYGEGEAPVPFSASLGLDGFGDFMGALYATSPNKILLNDIHIGLPSGK